jgi:Lysine methyltransferase
MHGDPAFAVFGRRAHSPPVSLRRFMALPECGKGSRGMEDGPEDEDEAWNPFCAMGGFDDDSANKRRDRPATVRRPWGIPTFEEQCNGVNHFTFGLPDGSIEENGQERITQQQKHRSSRPTVTIRLEHRKNSTGSDVWDAALVLAYALSRPGVVLQADVRKIEVESSMKTLAIESPPPALRVLELGSGTGALGLYCFHVLSASQSPTFITRDVCLTDLPANLPLLQSNVELNRRGNGQVTVAALDWTSITLPNQVLQWAGEGTTGNGPDSEALNGTGLDLIVGSDLFLPFAPALLQSLAQTLRRLLELGVRLRNQGPANPQVPPPPPVQAILCYEERFDCSDFFTWAAQYGLQATKIPPRLLHPFYQDPERIHVIRVTMANIDA